jgi:type II secretory pathway pseudopilin PulG
MKRRNKKGMTLIEVTIGSALTALLFFALASVLKLSFSIQKDRLKRNETESDISQLVNLMLKVGRLSQSCTKITSPNTALECTVDMTVPPSGVNTLVRFELISGSIYYKVDSNHDGSYASTETKLMSENITAFDICNDSDMSGVSPTCPLQPAKISIEHGTNQSGAVAAADRTPVNRFFRFRIKLFTQELDATGKAMAAPISAEYQASFFSRNPPIPNVAYQWGGLE